MFSVSLRHKALPDVDDIRPLKAMVDYSALVHPDHPLRKEGQDGIELYIGKWREFHCLRTQAKLFATP